MPLSLSKFSTLALAVALSAVMWMTRGHHAASLTHLPDASWAIFFLAGFYFRQRMLLPLFLAQAALVDYLSIAVVGVDDYCVTAAYAFLLPAYSALWLAGRWYAAHYRFNVRSLPLVAAAATVGAFVCELVSSGSFYFLGGALPTPACSNLASASSSTSRPTWATLPCTWAAPRWFTFCSQALSCRLLPRPDDCGRRKQ